MIESESLRLSKIVDQILLAGQLDADAVELEHLGVRPGGGRGGRDRVGLGAPPRRISLDLTADGARSIDCDENKLRQVLVNLVDNAIKYSPDGGQVDDQRSTGTGTAA